MRKIWFRSQAEQQREDYEAMVQYFLDYLYETLIMTTSKEWERMTNWFRF